jgi:hypothetical protein
MEATLTIKVKHLHGQVLQQSLGQLLRTLLPDLVTYATSQANDIRGAVRESCPIRDAKGRGQIIRILSQ